MFHRYEDLIKSNFFSLVLASVFANNNLANPWIGCVWMVETVVDYDHWLVG